MSKPVRIQLSRTKGWKMPPNTVKVDRSTKWGNPMRVGEAILAAGKHVGDDGRSPLELRSASAEDCVNYFRKTFGRLPSGSFAPLRGKNLACWCKIGEPCHADVLLELANQ